MEYTAIVDLGQAGNDVEIEVDICDDYIHEYVTQENDSDWAREHFEYHGDVDQFVKEQLDEMDDDDFMALVAERMGLEK